MVKVSTYILEYQIEHGTSHDLQFYDNIRSTQNRKQIK